MSLGDAIRMSRQKAFFTQQDFSKKLNVALSTVNRWELNKAKPNMETTEKSKIYAINMGWSTKS